MRGFFLALCFIPWQLFCVVRFLTFHCNHADFIEMQYKTLHAFFVDEFEYLVFNDAYTEENDKAIEAVCKQYGIKCIRFEQRWHESDPLNSYLKERLSDPKAISDWFDATTPIEKIGQHPSVRHCHVIQYALDHYGYDHDDIVVIMDGDNFLIRPLSLRQMLNTCDIVGFAHQNDYGGNLRKQSRASEPFGPKHAWETSVVFIAFNPKKLPECRLLKFHVDVVDIDHPHHNQYAIADSGAGAYHYLKKYPETKIHEFYFIDSCYFRTHFSCGELYGLGWTPTHCQFIHAISPGAVQFFMFEHFLHLSGGSFGEARQKVMHLHRLVDALIEEAFINQFKRVSAN